MVMMTEKILIESPEYKQWIGDYTVHLIHNTCLDFPTFIVIYSDKVDSEFHIARFWRSPNRKDQLDKIHVSIDHKYRSAVQVFKLLLSDYSTPV